MLCPVCKTRKCNAVRLDENLEALRCASCGGHWISRPHYSAWLKGHGDPLPEKPLSAVQLDVQDIVAAKLCPGCRKILLKFRVGHGLDFSLDRCPGCGGVWFDRNEWEALRQKNLHDEIHRIFCTDWQRQVRREEMAAQLDRLYGNRLGMECYERAKEIREWLRGQPQRQAILAFLADDDPYAV